MDGIVGALDVAVGKTGFRHLELIELEEFLAADLREDTLNGISSKDSLPENSSLLVPVLKLFRAHFNPGEKRIQIK